jgi:hypothetical protein
MVQCSSAQEEEGASGGTNPACSGVAHAPQLAILSVPPILNRRSIRGSRSPFSFFPATIAGCEDESLRTIVHAVDASSQALVQMDNSLNQQWLMRIRCAGHAALIGRSIATFHRVSVRNVETGSIARRRSIGRCLIMINGAQR